MDTLFKVSKKKLPVVTKNMEKYEFVDKLIEDLDGFYDEIISYENNEKEKNLLERKISLREDIIRRVFSECQSSLRS